MRKVLAVVKRVMLRIAKGPVLDEAAQLAFYAVLALVPFLVMLSSLAALIPEPETVQRLMRRAHFFMPPGAYEMVSTVVEDMLKKKSSALLTFGVVTSVWSASRAANAFRSTLNLSFNVEEGRSWVRQQGISIVVTVLGAILLLLSVTATLLGTSALEHITGALGLEMGGKSQLWLALRLPLSFLSIVLLTAMVYRVLPDASPRAGPVFLGATVATLIFVLISRIFTFYVSRFASFGATYGSLTGLVALLLWAWLSAIAFVVGGEIVAALPGLRERRRDTIFDRDILAWRKKKPGEKVDAPPPDGAVPDDGLEPRPSAPVA